MLPNPKHISEIIRRTAETEILPLFCKLKDNQIDKKESGEIVTVADIKAEKKLTKALIATVPDSIAVGEEAVSNNISILDRLAGDKPIWIIDPLDGTRNFANGKECFAVIVAYCQHGETLAGWIYDPVNRKMFYATKGQGAWVNDTPLKSLASPSIVNMSGSVSKRNTNRLDKLRLSTDIPAKMTRYRCTGREYSDLALGVLHFAEYELLKPWDHAAGILIHAEVGGYSAFVDDKKPYKPVPTIKKKLLIASNQSEWKTLRMLFSNNE